MTFQERLYSLRRARGLSQEELAHIVGVSRQAVQKWEAGTSRPDLDNLTALARCFDVSLDYLILGQEPTVPGSAADEGPVSAPEPYLSPFLFEYRSRAALFGLPLVHIKLARWGVCRAKGILAIGNVATGVIALGGLSVGVVSLGGLSLGLLALGGLAAGALLSVGGLALSLGLAIGGGAISLCYAMGGGAIAGQIAAGGGAIAPIAIGDVALGRFPFPTDLAGLPGNAARFREAVQALFPYTPRFLVEFFAQFC